MVAEVEVKPFLMPRPQRGSSLIFYVHGSKGDSPEIGFVTKIGAKAIVLQLASGLVMEGVRHVDDPRLQDGISQRENGAWDFTEDARTLIDLKKRVCDLEAKLSALTDVGSDEPDVPDAPAKKVHWKTAIKLQKSATIEDNSL